MDISRFGEFAILAQSRTFLDAAELLFMSQSTLSKHIMAMEHELGCKLIDRTMAPLSRMKARSMSSCRRRNRLPAER